MACDELEDDLGKMGADLDDLDDEILDLQRDQFKNYNEYYDIVWDALAEYITLGLFSEGKLGAALGGILLFRPGTYRLEAEIDRIHNELESLKAELNDMEDEYDMASDDLCECYWENE